MNGRKIKLLIGFLTSFSIIFASAASAFAASLPERLTIIEEEAFAGDANIKSLELSSNVKEIRPRAFANTQLLSIFLPESLTYIASDAFQGVSTPLLIETVPGSAAVSFALSHQIDFRANTDFRALLIGQSDYPEPHQLSGPEKDLSAMSNVWAGEYELTVRENLSVHEMLSAISSTFADASSEDISLFYYSGHGLSSADPEMNGALIGVDYASYLTASQLREALDAVPGRKIVLIDACYSGAFIGKGGGETQITTNSTDNEDILLSIEDPAASFVQAFADPPRMLLRSLAAQQYFVLAASTSKEKSYESADGGVFTQAFSKSRMEADSNGDGVVSFLECYKYTAKKVSNIVATGGLKQSVQVYPDNCYWFGIFR